MAPPPAPRRTESGLVEPIPLAAALGLVNAPFAAEDFAWRTCPILIVDCCGKTAVEVAGRELGALDSLPAVTVAMVDGQTSEAVVNAALHCDVVLAEGSFPEGVADAVVEASDVEAEVARLQSAVAANPTAAVSFVELLRFSGSLSAREALIAESLTYSTLLAGPEFAKWLATHRASESAPSSRAPDTDATAVVLVERVAGHLINIALNDPNRHNAFSAEMRDALTEALQVAVLDDSVSRVTLRGIGPSFCSGGDLSEFGSTPDPASAPSHPNHAQPGQSPANPCHPPGLRTRNRCPRPCHRRRAGTGGVEPGRSGLA